jgi:hypothetical protein
VFLGRKRTKGSRRIVAAEDSGYLVENLRNWVLDA